MGARKNVLVMITCFLYKADIDAQTKNVFFSSLTRREIRVIICQNNALGETNENIAAHHYLMKYKKITPKHYCNQLLATVALGFKTFI